MVSIEDNDKTLCIYGLDENYNLIDEIVPLINGTLTTKIFKRVYRAEVHGGSNLTEITLTTNGDDVLKISIGNSQTLMAIYTVPAGKTAFAIKGVSTCQANADATIRLFTRRFGEDTFRIKDIAEIAGVGGPFVYEYAVPRPLPEKSDIDFRATVRSNNARVTVAFDLILVDNEYLT